MRILILSVILVLSFFCYSQNDSTKVKELLNVGTSFEKTSMDSAIYNYKKAAKLAKNIKYWIGAGRASSYTGIVFSDYGMNDSAIYYHKKSIPLYERANYSAGVASSYINLGNSYQFLGDYKNSTDYYIKGIEVYHKLKDTLHLIYTYENFASLFTDFKLFNKSKEYQSKALEYSYKIGDTISAGYLLNDLGLTYLSLHKKDSAFLNFNKALNIAEKFNHNELKYYSNKNLNNYYFSISNYLMALQYAIKSYKNAVITKKPYYKCYSLNTIGTAHLKLNKLDSAYYYIKKSIAVASKIKAKEHLMDGYYALNLVYSKQQKYKEAHEAIQLYNLYHDSVIGQNQQEYTSRLEQQYQVKHKDNEILQQQLEIKKNESLLQKQVTKNSIYIIGLLLLSFIAFIFWYRHRQRKKLNIQAIETLEKQQELKSLAALIEGENLERARIAKDLHDSVNGNLSAIKHNLSSISQNNLNSEEHGTYNMAIQMLDIACEQIRNISHDLVPPSLLNFGLLEALEQYINRMNTAGTISVVFQYFGTYSLLPNKVETIIYHIIQELLNNIVKHSDAKKAIVQINASKKALHITVEDDGKGYDTNATNHGLGLNNINSRIEFLNADIDVKSDNKGTSVIIDINLLKIPQL